MMAPAAEYKPIPVVNVPDISPKSDAFADLQTASVIEWTRLSGLPQNIVERNFKFVRFSRYRASIQAALAAKSDGYLISHLPLMTASVAHALKIFRKNVPHLGFAFNFTNLPSGKRLSYLRHSLRSVDQFAVFSRYEQGLYANLFELPPERIVPVIWTQDSPPVDRDSVTASAKPTLCAIGGEGRDFRLLLDVARRLGTAARLVIIARPHSLAGLAIPDNVDVLTNIPLARVWGIASASNGVLLPLRDENTCCGHITLVSAKLLGLPLATTRAYATQEYVDGRAAVLSCEPNDAKAFADLAARMLDEPDLLATAARASSSYERDFHRRHHWATYVDDFITAHPHQ